MIVAGVVLASGVLTVLIFSPDWGDSVPAWLSGIGGILGALASIYALSIAVQADTEHVTWRANVTKTSSKGTAVAFELVNVSKATVATILGIEDATGDHTSALDMHIELPVEVPPGAGIPIAVSRSLSNSSPTSTRITWTERRSRNKRGSKRIASQMVYL